MDEVPYTQPTAQSGMEAIRREIKRLDPKTARKISSSQVITSLADAVKELLENAVDARANSLIIRFENYYDKVDVIDNGHGIERVNFDLLCKRSCTSKLESTEDLEQVGTFGFRGEALNSLCNIAQVTVHTRHAADPIGTYLEFDSEGQITSKKSVAREGGTTISFSKLFHTLHVRRKELQKNHKRAFDQTLGLIYQYCVGAVGLKISVMKKGSQETRYTPYFICNGVSVQANIHEVFDYKQFSNLMPFVCHTDLDGSITSSNHFEMNITGFISLPDTGCGRSSPDRQYFYLNERPCDLVSVRKRINEIYRNYNRQQYPFVLLKLTVDEKMIDRNITPDKRKVIFDDSDYILKVIVHSLQAMFERETVEVSSLSSNRLMTSFLSSSQLMKRDMPESDGEDGGGEGNVSFTQFADRASKMFKSCPSPSDRLFIKPTTPINKRQPTTSTPVKHPFLADISNFRRSNTTIQNEGRDESVEPIESDENESFYNKEKTEADIISDAHMDDLEVIANRKSLLIDVSLDDLSEQYSAAFLESQCNSYGDDNSEMMPIVSRENTDNADAALAQLRHTLTKTSFGQMRVYGQFNLGFIIARVSDSQNDDCHNFHLLLKWVKQSETLIGAAFFLFLSSLQLDSNLYIIDQHAIDERYNFEQLLQNPKLEYQKLLSPLDLRLSVQHEMIVQRNLDIFKAFGFGIVYNREGKPGHRVLLSQIPIGKEWTPAREDVEQIIGKRQWILWPFMIF